MLSVVLVDVVVVLVVVGGVGVVALLHVLCGDLVSGLVLLCLWRSLQHVSWCCRCPVVGWKQYTKLCGADSHHVNFHVRLR